MRDGVVLRGDLHEPVDPAGTSAPTVVMRSPYGRRGLAVGRLPGVLAARGHPVFVQSCRGTAGSGGTFTPQVHEQDDGVDTLRWVRRQPWFTGRLVTCGASYLGYVQWAVAGHLRRTEPETAPDGLCLYVTMPDFGAITWDNGAFALRNALGWTRLMSCLLHRRTLWRLLVTTRRLPRALDHVPLGEGDAVAVGHPVGWYQDWLEHDDLSAPYWTQQSHTASAADVAAPVTMVTGWYDIFLPWQLRDHARLAAAGNPPELTVGPWGHVSRGMGARAVVQTVDFLGRMAAGSPAPGASVRVFVTGAREWRGYPSWPPPGVADRSWFLAADGALAGAAPAGDGVTAWVYDPRDPTPALGGPSLGRDVQPVDNAAHERRADVVTFTTGPLESAVEVVGEPRAVVWLRSDRPTADLFVRLCDVHPDGRSMTVCDGIRRVGGRGDGGDEPARTASTPHVAHQEVLHGPGTPSAVVLPVLPV